jgi:hypothetical protein
MTRQMPRPVQLGQHVASTIATPIWHWRERQTPTPNNQGYRTIMGYFLPTWQRGLVWSEAQNIKLIESLWLGLNIGTYSYNRSKVWGGPLDNLLIDGQQRMWAIQQYLEDAFPVFGCRFSEVSMVDRRRFEMTTHFHSYVTDSEDEAYLRSYYDLMNFGGVAHKESERA